MWGRSLTGHLGAGSGAILRQSSQPIRHKAGHKGGHKGAASWADHSPANGVSCVVFSIPLARFKPSRLRLKNILDVRAAEIDVQRKLAEIDVPT